MSSCKHMLILGWVVVLLRLQSAALIPFECCLEFAWWWCLRCSNYFLMKANWRTCFPPCVRNMVWSRNTQPLHNITPNPRMEDPPWPSVAWAIWSMYHTVLSVTPRQLVFECNILTYPVSGWLGVSNKISNSKFHCLPLSITLRNFWPRGNELVTFLQGMQTYLYIETRANYILVNKATFQGVGCSMCRIVYDF